MPKLVYAGRLSPGTHLQTTQLVEDGELSSINAPNSGRTPSANKIVTNEKRQVLQPAASH